MENEPLQQFLTLTDRMIPRHERRHNLSNVDELTQHKMRKAKKEAEKLQMSQKNSQPNEVTFRSASRTILVTYWPEQITCGKILPM